MSVITAPETLHTLQIGYEPSEQLSTPISVHADGSRTDCVHINLFVEQVTCTAVRRDAAQCFTSSRIAAAAACKRSSSHRELPAACCGWMQRGH